MYYWYNSSQALNLNQFSFIILVNWSGRIFSNAYKYDIDKLADKMSVYQIQLTRKSSGDIMPQWPPPKLKNQERSGMKPIHGLNLIFVALIERIGQGL